MLNEHLTERIISIFNTTHDNRDKVIAHRLKISKSTVGKVLATYLDMKMERINQRVNTNYEYEQKQLRES